MKHGRDHRPPGTLSDDDPGGHDPIPLPSLALESTDASIGIVADGATKDLSVALLHHAMYSGTVATAATVSTGTPYPDPTGEADSTPVVWTEAIAYAPSGMFQVDPDGGFGGFAGEGYIGLPGTYLFLVQAVIAGGSGGNHGTSVDPAADDLSGVYGMRCEATNIHDSRNMWGGEVWHPCDRFGRCRFQSIGGFESLTPDSPSGFGMDAYYYGSGLGDLALSVEAVVLKIKALDGGDYSWSV